MFINYTSKGDIITSFFIWIELYIKITWTTKHISTSPTSISFQVGKEKYPEGKGK